MFLHLDAARTRAYKAAYEPNASHHSSNYIPGALNQLSRRAKVFEISHRLHPIATDIPKDATDVRRHLD